VYGLTLTEDDSATIQIVGGNFDRNAVSRDDADEVLPHLAGDVRQHFMSVVQRDTKLRVRQRLADGTFNFDGLFFGHNWCSPRHVAAHRTTLEADLLTANNYRAIDVAERSAPCYACYERAIVGAGGFKSQPDFVDFSLGPANPRLLLALESDSVAENFGILSKSVKSLIR
jgi:hypothetical protein